MKNLTLPIYALLFLLIVSQGCKNADDIVLRDLDPVVVIEGKVTDQPGPHIIRVTKSLPYYQNDSFPAVTGARVVLSAADGTVDTLAEFSPGQYVSNSVFAVGQDLSLSVTAEGVTYQAVDELRPCPMIDSVTVNEREQRGFLLAGKYVTLHFNETPGSGDHYRMIFYVNDSLYDDYRDLIVLDDQLTEGRLVNFEFPFPVKQGDKVTVVLQSISEGYYAYVLALQNLLYVGGNPYGAPPGNLPCNLTQGAKGYFRAGGERISILLIP